MELTGKIIAVLPANSGVSNRTGNPWMSQEYVIEVPGQYPRKCVFRIFGEDRIKQFNIQHSSISSKEKISLYSLILMPMSITDVGLMKFVHIM